MHNAIFSVLLCFFAIFGMLDIVKYILDRFYQNRLRGTYTILIDNADKEEDMEYLIRYLQSAVINRHDRLITGISVSKDAQIDPELFFKLQNEFENLRKV